MTTEETKKRLVKIRKTLAEQCLSKDPGNDYRILLYVKEAELLICLIDTVLRWDYEI